MLSKLKVIAVGKLKEGYLREGEQDFVGRLRPYGGVEIVEVGFVPDPPTPSPALVCQVLAKEAANILRHIKSDEIVVALDRGGRVLDSPKLASFVRELCEQGRRLAFVVGGSLGLGEEVLARARAKISLSALTFPHGLSRLILLEQLYRACKINAGEKYHK